MHKCCRCEALPENYPVEGTLFIAPPIAPLAASLKRYLQGLGAVWSEPYPDIFAVELVPGMLLGMCRDFFCTLGKAELADCKSLILSGGRTPSVQELVQMQPLSMLMARIQGEWLVELLREERITSYFQPIVACDSGCGVFGYECLLRGRDPQGGMVPPGLMFEVARDADLLFHLDRAARLKAIGQAQAHGVSGKIFINFNPTSIYNPSYCLQTTLAAIRDSHYPPADIVFEVVESDTVSDLKHLVDVMDFYRAEGFKVALDDLGAGYGSLNLLHHLRPDYLKLDMELVRDVDKNPYKARIAANLLELAGALGVVSIAEGIETVEEFNWCKRNGATLAQGYLFGKPTEIPARDVSLPQGQ